jgi:nucleoside-diphosphate-sugar epimerase
MDWSMPVSALVVGASDIVGNSLANHLVQRGWEVHGLARWPPADIEGVTPVVANLLDPASLRSALKGQRPEYLFITTWLRQKTETENIRINRAMVRNLFDALSLSGSVKHVAPTAQYREFLLCPGGRNICGSSA